MSCSWQVQYLVMAVAPRIVMDNSCGRMRNLECVFFVAGAVFGDVGV